MSSSEDQNKEQIQQDTSKKSKDKYLLNFADQKIQFQLQQLFHPNQINFDQFKQIIQQINHLSSVNLGSEDSFYQLSNALRIAKSVHIQNKQKLFNIFDDMIFQNNSLFQKILYIICNSIHNKEDIELAIQQDLIAELIDLI